MKKIITLVVAMILLMMPSFAEESEDENMIIQPYFTNIYSFHTYFDIDGNGKATVDVSLDGHAGDNSKVTAKIQRYVNGSWSTIKTFTTTSGTSDCSMSKSYFVTKGYSYRALVYGSVYSGQILLDHTNQITSLRIY